MLKRIVMLCCCFIITNNYAMNRAKCIMPLAALLHPEEKLIRLSSWRMINRHQKKLVEDQAPNYSNKMLQKYDLSFFTNNDLNKYGFAIQLSGKLSCYKSTVVIASKKYHWKSLVGSTQISHENVSYPAIYTTGSDKNNHNNELNELEVAIDGIKRFDQTVPVEISLPTTQDDTIMLHISSAMRKKYNFIKQQINDRYPAYHQIYIPKIDLDCCPDISWLKGMYYSEAYDKDKKIYIHDAQQQIQLQLDEDGIRFATAVALAQSPEKCEPITINTEKKSQHKGFGLTIQQSESSEPLLSAHIEVNDWKQPKKLPIFYPFSNPAMLDHIKMLQYMFDKNRWYDYKAVVNRLEELFYLLEKNPKMIPSMQFDQEIMHGIKLIEKQIDDLDSGDWSRLFHNHPELHRLLNIFEAYKKEFHP